MKVALFVPHGAIQREVGVAYLLANYMAKVGADVIQLRCDGSSTVCGRDAAIGWRRSLSTCLRCEEEQKGLAEWAGLKARSLGSYLRPDEILQSSQWIGGLSHEELLRAEFRGANIFAMCEGTFKARFGRAIPDPQEVIEGDFARSLLVAAVRTAAATDAFLTSFAPELAIVSGMGDVLEKACASRLESRQLPVATMRFDPTENVVVITSSQREEAYVTRLLFEGVTRMRTDPRTWPAEIISVVHEIMTFLDYAPDRGAPEISTE